MYMCSVHAAQVHWANTVSWPAGVCQEACRTHFTTARRPCISSVCVVHHVGCELHTACLQDVQDAQLSLKLQRWFEGKQGHRVHGEQALDAAGLVVHGLWQLQGSALQAQLSVVA